ncbi:MAG: hypothetical protein HYR56_24795 [Acidobacteria bacterium]|nr:hypothetical protein [Acidobacteriota bacterium]MBI3428131.1 hypothetical protein [Acidobacteriota bacterium]
MGLSLLLQSSRSEIESKHVQQIIAFAGQGKLLDESATSNEFRDFLKQVSSEVLERFASECLTTKFDDSGLALQDVVNQVGKRLGFLVKDGRYRGTKRDIGYDGLWRFPDGHSVIVEVKTTDAYRIDTSKIADYRKKLVVAEEIDEDHSSILIVVGREDTGDLEAQIRGSRYAWDIRLISVDALLKLMFLKESVDDPTIIQRICAILIPREFTRVDGIIDIVFSAAAEAKVEDELVAETEDEEMPNKDEAPGKVIRPAAYHEACVELFSQAQKVILVKRTRNTFLSPDGQTAIVCAVSKTHQLQGKQNYWFAFHPHQKEFLESHPNSYLVLGCGSSKQVLALPYSVVNGLLGDLWTTELEDRMYWHIRLQQEGAKLRLNRKKGIGNLDLSAYLLAVA